MCKLYTLKEKGRIFNTFAVVVERTTVQETLGSIRTAITDHLDCDCTIIKGDLDKVTHNNSQTFQVTAGETLLNIGVSEARLY